MGVEHACLLVSDFNVAPLAGYLRNGTEGPTPRVVEAPFALVEPVLLGEHEVWREEPNCALVWTRPQAACAAFGRLLQGDANAGAEIDGEIAHFVDLLLGVAARLRALFVPQWVLPPHERGIGVGDHRRGGVAWELQRMNAHLLARAEEVENLYVLDAARWLAAADRPFDAKLWYMAKVAFASPVLRTAAGEIKAALRALDGRAKKLIVLDLDDTLWGATVGEVGWRALRLGGHDPIGEAHVDFQRALKALVRRGVLLALASRNEESVALEAIDRHPEMILRRDDFAAWQIHWKDKAESVAALASELNIGLQDVVFIDDNPAERARVREALPEVWVPEWPAEPAFYVEALADLKAFDRAALSAEDSQRTELYAVEARRREERKSFSSLEAWLQRLDLRIYAEKLNAENGERAVQLLNKTNQMNLRTRRMNLAELCEWAAGEGRELWTLRVVDRFGDAGLTGLLGLEAGERGGLLCDFVLSCRVMGRQVEEAMLHFATRRAHALGWGELAAEYAPTKKNKPCGDFFARSALEREGDMFYWRAGEPLPQPQHVQFNS